MNNSTKCKVCGGQTSPYDYVCDFCGTVIFDNIKTTDSVEQGTLNFEDGMAIVQNNLNVLHDIPKPNFGGTIKAALRLLFALYTFGIILIFWRRPKKRFNRDVYLKLNNIIYRNISFLKISSKGNNDLLARIKVYEDELNAVDVKVKKGIFSKNMAITIVLAIFVSWFIYVVNQDPKTYSDYTITSFDTVARGNISDHIKVVSDTVLITHTKPGGQGKWQVDIRLKIIHFEGLNDKQLRYQLNLFLTDRNGVAVEEFEPGELVESSKTMLKEQISKPGQNISYYRFQINNKAGMMEYKDTIPPHVVKFYIQADTIWSKY